MKDQKLGDPSRCNEIAIHFSIDLECRYGSQQGAPLVIVDRGIGRGRIGHQEFKTGVEDARRVVRTLEISAEQGELECLVMQHRTLDDTSRQVRSELDPFEKITGILSTNRNALVALQLKPRRVQRFPGLGGQRAANGVRIFPRPIETTFDAAWVGVLERNPFNGGILGDGVTSSEIGIDLTDCRER